MVYAPPHITTTVARYTGLILLSVVLYVLALMNSRRSFRAGSGCSVRMGLPHGGISLAAQVSLNNKLNNKLNDKPNNNFDPRIFGL
jgi:hypothetical protein